MPVIYGIYSTHHDKIMYVGQTINLKRRVSEHIRSAFNPNSPSYEYPLYRSIRKYGVDNFNFYILITVPHEKLDKMEKQYVEHLNTYYDGYNLTKGGKGGNGGLPSIYPDEVLLAVVERIQNSNSLFTEIAEEFGVSKGLVSILNRGEHSLTANMKTPLRPHWNYRLPTDKVKRIQSALLQSTPQEEIMSAENVSRFIVSSINRGHSYTDNNLTYPLNPMGYELTKEDVTQIITLLKGKQTMAEIGEICGVGEKTVSEINLGYRKKLPNENYPIRSFRLLPNIAEQVKMDLLDESLTIGDIAIKYGKTKGTIYNINCGKTFFTKETNYPIRVF